MTSFDAGVKGILIATVVGTGASRRCTASSVARTYLRGHYDWRELRTMLRYGLPLIPGLVALWATAYADRLLLANFKDLDAVGLYAIASRFAAPDRAAADRVRHRLPAVPARPAGRRPGAREASCAAASRRSTAVALLGGRLPLAVFGPELIAIVTPGYDGAAPAISPLVLGTAAYGVASVFLAPLLIHRRTDVSAALTVVMGVANVALCVALIPPFGLVGAAIASFARLRAAGSAVLVVGPPDRRRAVRAWPPGGGLRAGRGRRRGVAHRSVLGDADACSLKLAVCVGVRRRPAARRT